MHIGVRKEDGDKCCLVYAILCLENGKAYVGQTRRSLKRRWCDHVARSFSDKFAHSALYGAIRKYGPNNFSVHVLQKCALPNELNGAEIKWIAELGTYPPENGKGYNLESGGSISKEQSAASMTRLSDWWTPERRLARSIKMKGVPKTAATRLKMSLAAKERTYTPEYRAECATRMRTLALDRKPTPTSDETRKKISLRLTGAKRSAEFCAAQSSRRKGVPLGPCSKEHKAKLAEAARRRWARAKAAKELALANKN